jgi:hypothetical protein
MSETKNVETDVPRETTKDTTTAGAEKRDLPAWVVQWGSALIVSISVVLAYHVVIRPNQATRIGTVDIAKVYNDARTEYTDQYLKDNASPEEREKIKQKYVQFGNNVQTILDQLSRDCGCVIVVRQAVLNANATDFTAVVKEKLGI